MHNITCNLSFWQIVGGDFNMKKIRLTVSRDVDLIIFFFSLSLYCELLQIKHGFGVGVGVQIAK